MNPYFQNASASNSASGPQPGAVCSSAEATLRLIASLPAPDGLPERILGGVQDRLQDQVRADLRAARPSARILTWPTEFQPAASWMRAAAAAAIVFVVAGGGWGVYTRVQPTQPAKVLVMPTRTGTASGFSSAAAMRTPQTLDGPVIAQPVTVKPKRAKAAVQSRKSVVIHPQSVVAGKAATQSTQPSDK